jgi:hypothetical protein
MRNTLGFLLLLLVNCRLYQGDVTPPVVMDVWRNPDGSIVVRRCQLRRKHFETVHEGEPDDGRYWEAMNCEDLPIDTTPPLKAKGR